MGETALLGNLNTGAVDGPSPAVEGSPDVFINGRPVLRVGDHFADGSMVTSGAPNVFINGRQAARLGDPVSEGGSVAEGCPKVCMGDHGGTYYIDHIIERVPCIAEAMAEKTEDENEKRAGFTCAR